MPLPAQPTPGVGPPASMHRTPLNPVNTISLYFQIIPFAFICSNTVGIPLPPIKFLWNLILGRNLSAPLYNLLC